MDIHYLPDASDTRAACSLPVLTAPASAAFSTRHDQATCGACKAAF